MIKSIQNIIHPTEGYIKVIAFSASNEPGPKLKELTPKELESIRLPDKVDEKNSYPDYHFMPINDRYGLFEKV